MNQRAKISLASFVIGAVPAKRIKPSFQFFFILGL
jgi:hypothetical protein